MVISKYGASGDYPPCTDLAYKKAILDGVDILDCPVQMSKDGIPFCFNSIDLIKSTNVAKSSFSNLSKSIPEIQAGDGIFAFDLAWNDIKRLSRKSNGPLLFIPIIYIIDLSNTECYIPQLSESSCLMRYKYTTHTIIYIRHLSKNECYIPQLSEISCLMRCKYKTQANHLLGIIGTKLILTFSSHDNQF